ncbi:MAG: N-6 DNA methylase [Candidatus Chloroheliales bacterium]|nr:MAG: N-6 DNA methylase [Chloroflexota bacterium]
MTTLSPRPAAKRISTQQELNSAIWAICDILRQSNYSGAVEYVPELTWLLFLRILDQREEAEAKKAAAVGAPFTPSLAAPYRWRDWARPGSDPREGKLGALFEFVNHQLLPHLKALRDQPNATSRQKVIGGIVSGIEQVRVESETSLKDVLDRIHAISDVDPTHMFAISQAYEGLLLRMGDKKNDGGQFFTPREIIRAMVQVVKPQLGQTIYDPCCGTGGFLAQAYEYIQHESGKDAAPQQISDLKQRAFYGREKAKLIYPITLANLVLHGIDQPNIWYGNTLTDNEFYAGLFDDAPNQFDIILTNPPFGGKEGDDAQTRFAYKTKATQVLFLQHVINKLKKGGQCGMVVDEGVLFKTNELAFVQTKRKLLDECNLYCIVSLPAGVFDAANAGVKTDLLFFTKGEKTERIWYYDLSSIKVGKKTPFTLDRFDDFFKLLPTFADGPHSWSVSRKEIEAKNYDLKAVNPNASRDQDTRTPAELLDIIAAKGEEVAEALSRLRGITALQG